LPLSDLEIIKEVLSGRREAYADLVHKYQGKVLQLCHSLLSDGVLAEDAAQEVFIKAFRFLSKFRGKSSFSTWLYRITSNHCTDLLRHKSREKTESWEALMEREGSKLQKILSTPAHQESDMEKFDLLQAILSCLSPEYRTVLILREVQGLTYQEMTEVLSCSLDSVKARLRRARKELDEKLRHFLAIENVSISEGKK